MVRWHSRKRVAVEIINTFNTDLRRNQRAADRWENRKEDLLTAAAM